MDHQWVSGRLGVAKVGQVEMRLNDRDPGGRGEVDLEHLVKGEEGQGG